jgi:hypothetical protein
MAQPSAQVGLSRLSRLLTAATAVGSGVLGLLLFLAPGWAAPRFAWSVSELVAMSIGGWFLGNAIWAARIARDWNWARWSSGLAYLWGFGGLQACVLAAHADKVRSTTPLAWLYLAMIGVQAVAAVVGVADVVRLRPSTRLAGPPVPRWLRVAVVAFVIFVTFLFAVAMLRPSAAVGGAIFPEDMSPFTVRSFGVYFLTLVLGALLVTRRPTLEPLTLHMEGGLGITVSILIASLAHLDVFDFGAHPGQWIYLGSYVLVLVISVPTVIHYRRAARVTRPRAEPDTPDTTRRTRAT